MVDVGKLYAASRFERAVVRIWNNRGAVAGWKTVGFRLLGLREYFRDPYNPRFDDLELLAAICLAYHIEETTRHE